MIILQTARNSREQKAKRAGSVSGCFFETDIRGKE